MQRSDDLHGGNALPRQDARGFQWQGGHARHFQRACQAVIRHHGGFAVNVAAPERVRFRSCCNVPVGKVGDFFLPAHRLAGIPI